jgi:hypothetical protein
MERYTGILQQARKVGYFDDRYVDLVTTYLRDGDPGLIEAIKASHPFPAAGFANIIPAPAEMDEHDRRLLRLAVATHKVGELRDWLYTLVHRERPGDDAHAAVAAALREAGADEAAIHELSFAAAQAAIKSRESGEPTSLGRHLLRLSEPELAKLLGQYSPYFWLTSLLVLFARHGPERIGPLLSAAQIRGNAADVGTILLSAGGERFMPVVADLFARETNERDKMRLGLLLAKRDPRRWGEEVLELGRKQLKTGDLFDPSELVEQFGEAILPDLIPMLKMGELTEYGEQHRRDLLANIARVLKRDAAPALLAAAEGEGHPRTRAEALQHLIALNDPTLSPRVDSILHAGLSGDARTATRFAAVALRAGSVTIRETLWSQVAGKRKLPREAAAEALAADDPEALDRAAALMAEKSKDARWGGVLVLAKLGTPAAIDVLLERLGREENDDVRDEAAKAIRAAGVGIDEIVKRLGPVSLEQLREKAAAVKQMPVQWLEYDELPEMRMLDGDVFDRSLARYLLYRQARQREPIPDPEAAPVYALIDRKTSGDFAMHVLDGFLSGATNDAAWAMIVAGILGDNRVITTLTAKVRGWADDFAQKLATWGVEALALNGSNAALSAVHSLAEKYRDNPRRKYAIVGAAAQEAIELAAKRLGVSLDELGDRIVPTLGFEPGQPRRIEAGGRIIEATIGLDFKLAMKDAKTGKRAVSIPKSAPPEVQAEFKGLGKLLQEVAKSQTARFERLMVGQHRWPASRWRELFLQQPIVFPFAVRLVFGAYHADGKLLASFRALPDRTLTDPHDEPVELEEAWSVGIVHPLDLSPEQRSAWQQHLHDYEIEPPFLQIDRPVVTVPDELRQDVTYERLRGATLNGFSFRGKAERSGWTRGPVGDDAMVLSYRKRFAPRGIDAFVTLDGLPIYADPTATVTIQQVLFLPTDTKPEEFHAKRLRLGELSAMVFSETVGDLVRITGRTEGEGDATNP